VGRRLSGINRAQLALGICLVVAGIVIGYMYVVILGIGDWIVNNDYGNGAGTLVMLLLPLIFLVVGITAIYSGLHPGRDSRAQFKVSGRVVCG
jgi:hypothetical protein